MRLTNSGLISRRLSTNSVNGPVVQKVCEDTDDRLAKRTARKDFSDLLMVSTFGPGTKSCTVIIGGTDLAEQTNFTNERASK